MNTKQNTLKTILCGLIGIILIVMAHFGVIMLKQANFIVYADSENGSLTKSITNANFTSSTTKVTGFESYGYISNTETNIVDLSKGKYPNAKRGTGYDNYVLCLSSESYANYGYKNASNNLIKVNPNSNYMITVDVYTDANSGIADLYLYNNSKVYASLLNINTSYSWNTYTFFVSTNDLTELDLALGMNLDGSGTAMFDNISVTQLSNQKYNSKIATAKAESQPHTVVNSDSNLIAKYQIKNGSFEKLSQTSDLTLSSSELSIIKDSSTLTKYSGNDQAISINYNEVNSDGTNNNALSVNNSEATFIKYHTEDDFLTFKQNNLYKVSLNVKAENLSGKVNLQLVRTNAEKNDKTAKDSEVVTISSTSKSENVTNNYEEISFYVNADPYKDTTYKLVFGLGDETTGATGKVYFNTLTISKIDYKTFSSANSSNKLDLASYYAYSNTESDSIPMLNNGEFDAMEVTDVFNYTPAQPTNWSVSTGSGKQYYGVVNTSKENFEIVKSLNTSNISNPYGSEGKNNNVLMMYNEDADTLSYTSSTRTLKANTYHRYTIDVKTQLPSEQDKVTIALVATVNNKEVVLSSKNVVSATGFTPVDMYIRTANQELKVAVKITLETNGYGYAYIDNAKFDFPLVPSETKFNQIDGTSAYISKVDLTNSNSNIDYFTSSDSSVVSKVINLSNAEDLQNFATTENMESFTSIGEVDAIAIRANSYVNYTLKSDLGYDLTYSASSKNFYKVTVYVFTRCLETENEEVEEFGASIKLNGYESSFNNIQSDNAWTPYTFYISPDSAKTIYLEFGLGSTETLAKGDLFIANISVENITENFTEDKFNALEDGETIKVVKTEAKDDSKEDEKSEEETEKEPIPLSTILYWAAGSITSIALIIAIVGIALRKIKFKKPVKKSKNEYDRNKTVSKQLYMRKATTERENKLRELNSDLEKLVAERTKFEEDYKKDLSKLRELKIKRASANEIAKFEREMKKNQKLSASLGVTINRVQSEIQYAQTDAYLNALMRKLARETTSNLEDNKETK